MKNKPLKIVIADDEEINLEIITRAITNAGHEAFSFEDGSSALQYIENNPNNVDVIILDKIMPNMSGIDLIKIIKSNPNIKNIPVILQTGDFGIEQIKEGLDAGAYYYLSKPFYPDMLLSLVNAAARDCMKIHETFGRQQKERIINQCLTNAVFEIKNFDDAIILAAELSSYSNNPEEARIVIYELLVNSIEHGNLGIGYEEKNQLLQKNIFEIEVKKLLAMPKNSNKYVKVIFAKLSDKIILTIEDQGPGFDWKKYLDFDPARITDLNGRGVASSKLLCKEIEYIGSGNKVKCEFKIAEKVIHQIELSKTEDFHVL